MLPYIYVDLCGGRDRRKKHTKKAKKKENRIRKRKERKKLLLCLYMCEYFFIVCACMNISIFDCASVRAYVALFVRLTECVKP